LALWRHNKTIQLESGVKKYPNRREKGPRKRHRGNKGKKKPIQRSWSKKQSKKNRCRRLRNRGKKTRHGSKKGRTKRGTWRAGLVGAEAQMGPKKIEKKDERKSTFGAVWRGGRGRRGSYKKKGARNVQIGRE